MKILPTIFKNKVYRRTYFIPSNRYGIRVFWVKFCYKKVHFFYEKAGGVEQKKSDQFDT